MYKKIAKNAKTIQNNLLSLKNGKK